MIILIGLILYLDFIVIFTNFDFLFSISLSLWICVYLFICLNMDMWMHMYMCVHACMRSMLRTLLHLLSTETEIGSLTEPEIHRYNYCIWPDSSQDLPVSAMKVWICRYSQYSLKHLCGGTEHLNLRPLAFNGRHLTDWAISQFPIFGSFWSWNIFQWNLIQEKVLPGLALGKVYISLTRFAIKHQLGPILYCLFGWSFSKCLKEKLCLRKVVGIWLSHGNWFNQNLIGHK